MINIEIFKGQWTLDSIDNNKLFIFNDNNSKIGNSGLSIIRNLPNSLGIRVKKGPSKNLVAFYNDSDYEKNIANITEDILAIKKRAFLYKKTIVFSSLGYGNKEDRLYETAPKTFQFLTEQLRYHFGFDNITGKSWNLIPSSSDILNSYFINIDSISNAIVRPINSSITLYEGESINDMIINTKKIAITQKVKYNPGDIITISSGSNNLVCLVCYSYNIKEIDKQYWSLFEGFPEEFIKSNSDIYKDNYKQTHFRFICSATQDGEIIIKDQPVYTDIKKFSFLGKIKKKASLFYKKNFRKSIGEFLTEMKISGELIKIENIISSDKGDYYKLVNRQFTYYIKFNKGFVKNSIRILIAIKNY
jgi:hypothetical protein